MPNATGLDERMRAAVDGAGAADILVGIPSFNNAATIAHVVRAVSEGLRTAFPDSRAVIVNADGGSSDGTPSRVVESADGVPAIAGAYRGLPGKGSAFRAIFEVAAQGGARACAVVDSDLRSITPMWVDRLLRPIVEGEADYVAPLYARHKHDGTITNTIAYPLTRALYGLRVRQP
ncbi:MAG: glycosyltransferase, partial [Chloroflexota bacterium]